MDVPVDSSGSSSTVSASSLPSSSSVGLVGVGLAAVSSSDPPEVELSEVVVVVVSRWSEIVDTVVVGEDEVVLVLLVVLVVLVMLVVEVEVVLVGVVDEDDVVEVVSGSSAIIELVFGLLARFATGPRKVEVNKYQRVMTYS
jgi:hypothetical protein